MGAPLQAYGVPLSLLSPPETPAFPRPSTLGALHMLLSVQHYFQQFLLLLFTALHPLEISGISCFKEPCFNLRLYQNPPVMLQAPFAILRTSNLNFNLMTIYEINCFASVLSLNMSFRRARVEPVF